MIKKLFDKFVIWLDVLCRKYIYKYVYTPKHCDKSFWGSNSFKGGDFE